MDTCWNCGQERVNRLASPSPGPRSPFGDMNGANISATKQSLQEQLGDTKLALLSATGTVEQLLQRQARGPSDGTQEGAGLFATADRVYELAVNLASDLAELRQRLGTS